MAQNREDRLRIRHIAAEIDMRAAHNAEKSMITDFHERERW